MNTITEQQQQAIAARLEGMTLPVGLGTEESACSIAAINLALTGKLTDKIPHCMSEVIGRWIIPIQDAIPSEMRNSVRWKSLLPLAAGTGRDMEQERLNIVMDWMWGTVLPALQRVTDRGGFGDAWSSMTTRRTEAAARAAWESASEAARDAADAAAYAAVAAGAGPGAAAWAAVVAEAAANADTDAWITFDPCDLLDRLIRVGEQQ